jgi:hypothetical protein
VSAGVSELMEGSAIATTFSGPYVHHLGNDLRRFGASKPLKSTLTILHCNIPSIAFHHNVCLAHVCLPHVGAPSLCPSTLHTFFTLSQHDSATSTQIANMALGQYRYEELSSETRFRLFQFEKSQPCSAACSNELRIHLFDVDFADPPPFEAISYAWGHHTASSAIICNGQQLLITPNVEAILRVLATQPDSVRTFWIDSICINQMSIPEKNVQVPRMRSIYSEARVVWVWLGADSFETKTAFKFLVEAVGVIEKSETSLLEIAWSSSELRNLFRCFRGTKP